MSDQRINALTWSALIALTERQLTAADRSLTVSWTPCVSPSMVPVNTSRPGVVSRAALGLCTSQPSRSAPTFWSRLDCRWRSP